MPEEAAQTSAGVQLETDKNAEDGQLTMEARKLKIQQLRLKMVRQLLSLAFSAVLTTWLLEVLCYGKSCVCY